MFAFKFEVRTKQCPSL